MTLCKKNEFFQKEPYVMLLVNKIGDTEKMITQIVQKDIAVAIRVIFYNHRTTLYSEKLCWTASTRCLRGLTYQTTRVSRSSRA